MWPASASSARPFSVRRVRRAAGERLVVAVGQWGIETPFAWRTSQSEKCLWDQAYDSLITRDPKTFLYRPGLATEWKPSNEMRTWTFKLSSGVAFHEGWGEMTAEDVKFTVEQNLKPDAQGGTAPYLRANLDRIETPDKLTVVMHFKTRLWDVPSQFSQFVGYQNITSKKYLESVGEDKAASHPIGTGPYRHVEGKQGDFHRFEAVPQPLAQDARLQGARDPPASRSRHADGGPPRGRDRHRAGVRRLPRPGEEGGAAHPRRAERRGVLGDPHRPDDAGPRGLLPDLSMGR